MTAKESGHFLLDRFHIGVLLEQKIGKEPEIRPEGEVAVGKPSRRLLGREQGFKIHQEIIIHVRRDRMFFHDPGYPELKPDVRAYDLAQGIFISEVFPGHLLGQDERIGRRQRRLGISGHQLDVEHVQEGLVGKVETFFEKLQVSVSQGPAGFRHFDTDGF